MEGRPRVPDRQALCVTLFMLHTGIQAEYLPLGLSFRTGITCGRHLAPWNEVCVWDQPRMLLKELRSKKKLDWWRTPIGSSQQFDAAQPVGPPGT